MRKESLNLFWVALFACLCYAFSVMRKNWLILAVVVLILVLLGLIFKSKLFGQKSPGGLQISTTPKAIVFLDGSQVGVTPFFDDKIEAGEHVIKLVPEATTDTLLAWEGKVNLIPGTLVVINRTLASEEAVSSGEILTLEKISSRDKSFLTVISIPDKAVVKIDGEPKGFAPVTLEDLEPGSYQVVVSSPGYEEKSISAKTVAGYKLVINVQLARQIEGIEEATSSGEEKELEEAEVTPTPELEKPYVRIKETPTGWLRVRLEPSTTATEAAKVNPGETFPYLNETENGWYKIEYQKGEAGWVSGVYAELIE